MEIAALHVKDKFVKLLRLLLKGGETRYGHIRPVWMIVLLVPLVLIYWPANKYVEWIDATF